MITIERRRPDPMPAIHPVWEYRAPDDLRARYEDMKAVLQVPWMGVVTLAFAHYPRFFDTLWEGLREVAASRPYVATARAFRRRVEAAVAALDPPPIAERLREIGYSDRELDEIRAIIEVFSHGNHIYGPLVFAAAVLLHGGELAGGAASPPPFEGRHAPDRAVPFVMMEPHHVAAETRAVYEDVMATLRLPFVNSDYRALARWPTYFALAWRDLRGVVGTPSHEAAARDFHDYAVAECQRLPNPRGLTAAALQAAAAADASLEEVREVCALFLYLIPGLVVNVAFFDRQLADR